MTTAGQVTVPFNYLLTDESGSFSYAITGGALPPGLTLSNPAVRSGTSGRSLPKFSFVPTAGAYSISGTPTLGGTFDYTITATDGMNSFTVNYRTLIFASPTAATVAIGGRVTAQGRALASARVVLTDQRGQTRNSITNAYGYFQFDHIPAGGACVIGISSKRYQFDPQLITVTSNVTDLEFSAEQ